MFCCSAMYTARVQLYTAHVQCLVACSSIRPVLQSAPAVPHICTAAMVACQHRRLVVEGPALLSSCWLQLIQRRCKVCSGKGLVASSRGTGRLRKCPECGGFFPWVSWRLFLTSNASPGNGGGHLDVVALLNQRLQYLFRGMLVRKLALYHVAAHTYLL